MEKEEPDLVHTMRISLRQNLIERCSYDVYSDSDG
jgi:hypothetical protein